MLWEEMFEDFQDYKKQRNKHIIKMRNNQSNQNMKCIFIRCKPLMSGHDDVALLYDVNNDTGTTQKSKITS